MGKYFGLSSLIIDHENYVPMESVDLLVYFYSHFILRCIYNLFKVLMVVLLTDSRLYHSTATPFLCSKHISYLALLCFYRLGSILLSFFLSGFKIPAQNIGFENPRQFICQSLHLSSKKLRLGEKRVLNYPFLKTPAQI